MDEAHFPVLVKETDDPRGLWICDDGNDLAGFVEEFADIIGEFVAWDRRCRTVFLRDVVDLLRRGDLMRVPIPAGDDATEQVMSAVVEYCTAKHIAVPPDRRDIVLCARHLLLQ